MISGYTRFHAVENRAQHASDAGRVSQHVDKGGDVFGVYRLVRRLGAGGMGVVYEAIDEERGFHLALKTLQRANPKGIARFKNEFRRAADLAHPNLVRLYELNLVKNTWFMTMELIDGVDFRTYVKALRASKTDDRGDRLRTVIRQMASGLESLHSSGLLHLDLKPTNVLVDGADRVVILDFGLSQPSVPEPCSTAHGELVATPLYLSPEQVAGRPPSRATDWYALGLMLFEALTGDLPFPGTVWESLYRRAQEPAPRPSSRHPDVPADLDELCAGLLELHPEARPAGPEILQSLGCSAPPILHQPVLIGRRTEMDRLMQLHETISHKKPVYVHLRGPSGVGKSALARHFLATLRSLGSTLALAGRCYEWESVPYKGLDPVIDGVAQHLDELSTSELDSLMDDDVRWGARVFPALRRCRALRDSERSLTQTLEPLELRRRAFAGLKRVFAWLSARQHVVVFLDDLQWGDADGAVLLAELMSPPNPPPLFVLAAYRDEDVANLAFFRAFDALRAAQVAVPEPIVVDLKPLGSHEAAQLADAFRGGKLAHHDAERIARESEGNPFLIEQLCRPDMNAIDEERNAVSLRRVVLARTDRLPAAARSVLRVLAVAGRPIEQGVLFEAARVSQHDPLGLLARLRAEHFVRTRGPRSTDPVETYHDKIRESVIAQLEAAELRTLHRSLADALSASGRADPASLAHHWGEAGELTLATEQGLLAAERANEALAFDRAADWYGRVLAWGRISPDQTHEILAHQGRALANAGRSRQAAAAFLEAAPKAPLERRHELKRLAVEAYLAAGYTDRGLDVARSLLADLSIPFPSSPLVAKLSLLEQFLRLQFHWGDGERAESETTPPESIAAIDVTWTLAKGLIGIVPLDAMTFALRSLAGAQKAHDRMRLARSLAFIGGNCNVGTGWLARMGREFLERAEAIAVELDDPYLRGVTQMWYAFSDLFAGRWRPLYDEAEHALALLKRCQGVYWDITFAAMESLLALEAVGNLAEVERRAQDFLAEAVQRDDVYSQVVFTQFMGYCRVAQGDTDGARHRAQWVMQHWTREGYTVQRAYSMRIEAYCDIYDGRLQSAVDRIEGEWPAIERSRELWVPMGRVDLLLLRARAHLALGAEGRQRASLDLCETTARRLEDDPVRHEGRAHACLLRAGLAVQHGDNRKARSLLARAAATYERLDMKLFAICARRRLSQLEGDCARSRALDAEIAALGVADPSRWLSLFAPGFDSDVRAG